MTEVTIRRNKLNRAEQTQATRQALMKAALRVVSRFGYAKASVSRITSAAGVSQGTFYSYFSTHQDLLSELLPFEGVQLLRELGVAAHGAQGYFYHERQTFIAFFDFLKRNPYFLRVLTEAEIAAPQSYAEHMTNIEEHYLNTLRRAKVQGEIRPQSKKAFRVLAEILAGARGHVAIGISKRTRQDKFRICPTELQISPASAAETYIKFIRSGIGKSDVTNRGLKVDRAKPKANSTSLDSRTILLQSAARLIYEHGYEATTVANVTHAANVAIGTFYSHFPSRKNLLDEVLSFIRTEMLDYVRTAVRGSKSFLEVEQRGFLAFFDYIAKNPWYISVETEAAVWATESYMKHFADLTARYIASMRRSKSRGELLDYEERDLPVLAFIFMAARHYISTRYILSDKSSGRLPSFISQVYFDFVSRGLR
jgi:AcrR family transcriptional regulator